MKICKKAKSAANEELNSTDADHVVYAIKYYNANDEIEEIHFHCKSMTADELEAAAGCLGSSAVIYALHRRS